jgi:cytidyltransferase-like protein
MIRGGSIGAFDLFHVGHLRFLEAAKKHCDVLFVGVGGDRICSKSKNKTPVLDENQRMEILQGLRCVNEVCLFDVGLDNTLEAAEWIARWGVDKVFVGQEWCGGPRWSLLVPLLSAKGIQVVWLPRTEGVSTTQIQLKIKSSE